MRGLRGSGNSRPFPDPQVNRTIFRIPLGGSLLRGWPVGFWEIRAPGQQRPTATGGGGVFDGGEWDEFVEGGEPEFEGAVTTQYSETLIKKVIRLDYRTEK